MLDDKSFLGSLLTPTALLCSGDDLYMGDNFERVNGDATQFNGL